MSVSVKNLVLGSTYPVNRPSHGSLGKNMQHRCPSAGTLCSHDDEHLWTWSFNANADTSSAWNSVRLGNWDFNNFGHVETVVVLLPSWTTSWSSSLVRPTALFFCKRQRSDDSSVERPRFHPTPCACGSPELFWCSTTWTANWRFHVFWNNGCGMNTVHWTVFDYLLLSINLCKKTDV